MFIIINQTFGVYNLKKDKFLYPEDERYCQATIFCDLQSAIDCAANKNFDASEFEVVNILESLR